MYLSPFCKEETVWDWENSYLRCLRPQKKGAGRQS